MSLGMGWSLGEQWRGEIWRAEEGGESCSESSTEGRGLKEAFEDEAAFEEEEKESRG